jgi:CubicO group peptidase (beta-lactamase class C family)
MIRLQARRPILPLLSAGFLGICFVVSAAQRAVPIPLSERVDPIVNGAMAEQKLPAVSVAIASRGKLDYDRAFGMADLENAVPATTQTLFRTGSIAKPITAVAAMQLVERGKLDLNAPVQTYCPAFPKKQWPITTRELLSHTSGIRHHKEHEIDSARHYGKTSDGFEIFAADPLLFEPGTSYLCSTHGYSVFGCVIEGASGKSYPEFVTENVLQPIGMTHTLVDDAFRIVPHRAHAIRTLMTRSKTPD